MVFCCCVPANCFLTNLLLLLSWVYYKTVFTLFVFLMCRLILKGMLIKYGQVVNSPVTWGYVSDMHNK